MSTISEFLKAEQPLFHHSLEQLEEITDKKGVDAKLTAEIAQKATDRIAKLGLAADVSGPDLYQALIKHVATQDEHLAKTLGGSDPTSIPEMIPLIVDKVEHLDVPRRGFFLREDVAKGMLLLHPPKQVMGRLGYDNAQQMLDKESVFEIYLALRFAEDPGWLNDFDADYTKLTADDFEERDLRFVIFDAVKWGNIAEHFIAKKRHNITHSKELGVIGVMPMTETHMKGITLKVLPLLVHYLNEVRLYSSFFKLMRTKRNFGEIVATTLIADPSHAKIMAGQKIHWRVVQRYYGKLPKERHPEQFQPHVQPEDLHWRRAEDVLYDIDPELEFWQGLDYVAIQRGEDTVTFNLMDISLSYSNDISYEERYLYHFREALWNEVFARYLGEKTLEEQVLQRLDNDVIAPETLG